MPSIVQLSQLTSSVIVAGLKSQKMIFSASHELSSAISRTLLRDITFLWLESLGSASLMIELQSRLIWGKRSNPCCERFSLRVLSNNAIRLHF